MKERHHLAERAEAGDNCRLNRSDDLAFVASDGVIDGCVESLLDPGRVDKHERQGVSNEDGRRVGGWGGVVVQL